MTKAPSARAVITEWSVEVDEISNRISIDKFFREPQLKCIIKRTFSRPIRINMCTNQVENLSGQVDFVNVDECYEPGFQMIPPYGDYDYKE